MPQRSASSDQIKSPPGKAKKAIAILISLLLIGILVISRRRSTPAQKRTPEGTTTLEQREGDALFGDSGFEEDPAVATEVSAKESDLQSPLGKGKSSKGKAKARPATGYGVGTYILGSVFVICVISAVILGVSEEARNYLFNASLDPKEVAKANITATAGKFMVGLLSANQDLTALQGHLAQIKTNATNLTAKEVEATLKDALNSPLASKGNFAEELEKLQFPEKVNRILTIKATLNSLKNEPQNNPPSSYITSFFAAIEKILDKEELTPDNLKQCITTTFDAFKNGLSNINQDSTHLGTIAEAYKQLIAKEDVDRQQQTLQELQSSLVLNKGDLPEDANTIEPIAAVIHKAKTAQDDLFTPLSDSFKSAISDEMLQTLNAPLLQQVTAFITNFPLWSSDQKTLNEIATTVTKGLTFQSEDKIQSAVESAMNTLRNPWPNTGLKEIADSISKATSVAETYRNNKTITALFASLQQHLQAALEEKATPSLQTTAKKAIVTLLTNHLQFQAALNEIEAAVTIMQNHNILNAKATLLATIGEKLSAENPHPQAEEQKENNPPQRRGPFAAELAKLKLQSILSMYLALHTIPQGSLSEPVEAFVNQIKGTLKSSLPKDQLIATISQKVQEANHHPQNRGTGPLGRGPKGR